MIRKAITVILTFLFITAFLVLFCGIFSEGIFAKTSIKDTTELHVIFMSKDDNAEVEVWMNDKPKETLLLDKGMNYISYNVKQKPEKLSVLAYGDSIDLPIKKGRNDELYTFRIIKPPTDGDGFCYD